MNEIRKYLIDRVAEIDTNLKPWNDGFAFDNIPSTIRDKSFFINYEITSTQRLDTAIVDLYDVNLNLFFAGKKDVQGLIDTAFNLADNIRINVIQLNKLISTNIHAIETLSMKTIPLDNNDNSFYIEISFNFQKVTIL